MATRAMSTTRRYCYAETPLGTVLLTGDSDGDGLALSGVYFTIHRYSPRPGALDHEVQHRSADAPLNVPNRTAITGD